MQDLYERVERIQSMAALHYPEANIRPIGGLADVEVVIQIRVRGKAQVDRALAALVGIDERNSRLP